MSKRLELQYIDITRAAFSDKTELKGSELYINKDELMSKFDTSQFESAEVFIVSPGDAVRVISNTDSTQPRVKVDDPKSSFPGMYGKLTPAGDGKTLALRGVLVTELYPLKANFKGMMDMSGPAADRSMLARHIHIILDLRPKAGT
jgi:glycine reductase